MDSNTANAESLNNSFTITINTDPINIGSVIIEYRIPAEIITPLPPLFVF